MKNVGVTEFRRSRNRQEMAAREIKDDSARRMLLFYAVECGAKYQYMHEHNYKLYKEVPKEYKNNMHDIKKLLKEIGLEAKCSFPVLRSKHNEEINPGEYQEMWRYGIDLKMKNEKEAVELIERNMNKTLELLHDIEGRK